MSQPTVIAHRGYAGVAPENTVAAAEFAAAREETEMLEIDVQPAACGTPVVFHDDRLDGDRDGRPITDGEGLVWETDLETLADCEVLESGASVPTLERFLAALPDSIGVNVELKNPGTADRRPGEALPAADRAERRERWSPFVERVVEVCEGFGGEILFSSFCEGAIAAARDVAAGYPAAALCYTDLEAGLQVARRYDCEAIHPPRNAIAGTALAGEAYDALPAADPAVDLLETAREAGWAVNVWTVDTWVQFDQLRRAGVDGIVVEYPGLGGEP
ncbi:glycerophosphodiester phosphodiesterase [Natrononativus amylolyticus]|uniref:glycerophosphodiester phosphodiesterase n=1 Tax=Natrononativus amylolyticus TaxID=2963434 RepID=UPI0020CC901D|nr:glycerophosphodiester phosphodiesterase [Natrononativus amylolyticus]